ncbi:MAG TPA: hypothetical protein VMT67_17485 [Terriglobales bacterium]|nr:hypothetical protein [Terriglobales bacterium]
MCNFRLIVCLGAALSTATAFAQVNSQSNLGSQIAQSGAIAYVYIAAGPGGGNPNKVYAYSANTNGTLTAISGSPFAFNIGYMAVNGKYLMGIANDPNTPDINAFKIGTNGALTYSTSTDYAKYNNPGGTECGAAGSVRFDHTGADLYVQEFDGTPACANDLIASFKVNTSNGSLTYLGDAVDGAFPGVYNPPAITANNEYGYSAANSACMYYAIYGFQQESNGLFNNLNETYNQPTPSPGIRAYVADFLATDPSNHLAVLEQPANPPGCASGAFKVASYTVDGSGNLTTSDTYKTMPTSSVQSAYDMKMSPSGELVAIAGQEGLQVFHFNGGSSVSHYTKLLTSDPIVQMFWDNNNHLYAISHSAGKLFVFTITPTAHTQAAGSPYSLGDAQYIIVQPLTKQ